jgi:hypothetical protein
LITCIQSKIGRVSSHVEVRREQLGGLAGGELLQQRQQARDELVEVALLVLEGLRSASAIGIVELLP